MTGHNMILNPARVSFMGFWIVKGIDFRDTYSSKFVGIHGKYESLRDYI